MMKKMMIGLILFLTVLVSNPTWTWASQPVFYLNDYAYVIDGNLKATINFPNYISLSVTLPKLINLGEYFVFCDLACNGQIWYDAILYYGNTQGIVDVSLIPTWEQNGTSFAIDTSPLTDGIAAMLNSLGVQGDLTKANFSGKTGSGGTISGKLTITYSNISVDLGLGVPLEGGTVSITMSYKGTKPTSMLDASSAKFSLAENDGWSTLKKNVSNLVSQAITLLRNNYKGDPKK